jgi:beta-1,4-mannosyl-glycoprotein beta-1,4-N-acetylglucosaminyltransferase
MIYDCFTIRDELDILELRLKLLDNIVDKFVICEADKTYTNISKPYFYIDHQERFLPWKDKIIYLPLQLDDTGLDFSIKETSYNPTSAAFQFEYLQRKALFEGIKHCQDDDIIFMGDLDEIPNPDSLSIKQPSVCVMKFFYYYINNQSIGPRDKDWYGTAIVPFHVLRDIFNSDMQKLRNEKQVLHHSDNCGWHLSYLGGKDVIRTKIKSFAHTEYNSDMFHGDKNIEYCLNNGVDIFHREGMNFKITNIKDVYPQHIIKILEEYPQFIYTN